MTAEVKTEPKIEPVIGLEIHIQPSANSKMFCACKTTDGDDKPNQNICPVCTGQPGTLPALNKRAVEQAVKSALALNCQINKLSVFARKNYFYPDCPKNYQITQDQIPLAVNGFVEIDAESGAKKIGITRLHIEEDASKLTHDAGDFSLIDFNRAGMPLMEIVSEPDMRSPDEAYKYLTALKNTLQWAEVSNCDMEKGQLRVDVNVSVRAQGADKFGTRVELKNLNSFKAVKDALTHEIERQSRMISSGGKVIKETRLWDDALGETKTMRVKEEAHDYRYFPEPDLPPLAITDGDIDRLRKELPELPNARKKRLMSEYALSGYDAEVLTSSKHLCDYFEQMTQTRGIDPKLAVNWLTTDLLGRLNAAKIDIQFSPIPAGGLAELVELIQNGKISGKQAKDVFAKMWDAKKPPADIVAELGLSQISDTGQIELWAKEAVAENAKAAADFKNGNEKAISALVGAVMKKSKGKANPALLNEILRKIIKQ